MKGCSFFEWNITFYTTPSAEASRNVDWSNFFDKEIVSAISVMLFTSTKLHL